MQKQQTTGARPRKIPGKLIILAVLILISSGGFSQVLFTYGRKSVSVDEFNKAYSKNNKDSAAPAMSYNDYLELYIRFKLKVQAAMDAGLDTTAEQKAELQSFRYQLAENFIREDASINLLVDEAAARTRKDIHLSHIFIPIGNEATDDSVQIAEKKINEAYERLKKGAPFDKVATDYQYASLGFITAFVLPYRFETIAYSIKPGDYSAPFRTQAGFHIIRNDGERKAVGKVRAAQILLAFPPDANQKSRQQLALRADSIYKALVAGADFGEMARQFSDDQHTFYLGGEMPAFGVGQYDTSFEKAAFALQKEGELSKPVETSFGYHIVKLLQRVPVPDDVNSKEWKDVVRDRVLQTDRMQVAHDKLIQSIRGLVAKDASTDELASDSAVLDYYRNHLEKYNAEFAEQLTEFKEGNLLFAIMQKRVWDAAVEDSAALKRYYEKNKQKYYWDNSADALILTCLVADSLPRLRDSLEKNYLQWRQIVESYNSLVQADSGRFELGQIPVVDRTNFTEGLITAPVVNEPDSSRTFAYIIKMYPGRSPKTFNDARGAVINDYQTVLEEEWIAELKKKYPVRKRQTANSKRQRRER